MRTEADRSGRLAVVGWWPSLAASQFAAAAGVWSFLWWLGGGGLTVDVRWRWDAIPAREAVVEGAHDVSGGAR